MPSFDAAGLPRVLHLPSMCLLVSDGSLASARDVARWRTFIGPNTAERTTLHILNKSDAPGACRSRNSPVPPARRPTSSFPYDRDVASVSNLGVRRLEECHGFMRALGPGCATYPANLSNRAATSLNGCSADGTFNFGRRHDEVAAPVPPPEPEVLPAATPNTPEPAAAPSRARTSGTDFIQDQVLTQIEPAAAIRMTPQALAERVNELVAKIAGEHRLLLNQVEQRTIASIIVDDMIGLGPLEPLLQDDSVSDIMINGPNIIYVERRGKLELTAYRFRNDAHVMHVAQRIASTVGRRVDESSPMLDARLMDGSRVNVIIAPLSLKGPCISIRKFSKSVMSFARFVTLGTLSAELAKMLEIAARCRLNIIISGGTGSGKTTLLNALSRMIDKTERIITIEDAAELQLQQPHVLTLETRPPNIEGHGQVTQRDLVRNALRMRPDRIIVGEVRGPEAFDMMQAMNTGHNGSMSTIHANTARDAIGANRKHDPDGQCEPADAGDPPTDDQCARYRRSDRAHARRRAPRHRDRRSGRDGGRHHFARRPRHLSLRRSRTRTARCADASNAGAGARGSCIGWNISASTRHFSKRSAGTEEPADQQ